MIDVGFIKRNVDGTIETGPAVKITEG